MKLSVVIICWNDLRVIRDCLRSIYEGTHAADFEVIISDNGSVDDSIEFVRKHYPQVRVVRINRISVLPEVITPVSLQVAANTFSS